MATTPRATEKSTRDAMLIVANNATRLGSELTTSRKAASPSPSSIDEDSMSVSAVLTTEAPVFVYSYELNTFVEEVLVAKDGKLPARGPLLDSHNRGRLADQLGFFSEPKRDDGAWLGRLHLTPGVQASEDAFAKIKAGAVDSVSIGYVVHRSFTIPPGESQVFEGRRYTASSRLPLVVAHSWTVYEVSLVSLPADKDAKVRLEPFKRKSSHFAYEPDGWRTHATPEALIEFERESEERYKREIRRIQAGLPIRQDWEAIPIRRRRRNVSASSVPVASSSCGRKRFV